MSNAKIYYHDIGDYLSREEKLKIIKKNRTVANMQWQTLTPNQHGDWLNQRNNLFSSFIPLEPEKKFKTETKSVFNLIAIGVATNRDAWAHNFSKEKLSENMLRMVDFYNEQSKKFSEAIKENPKLEAEKFIDTNETKISWTVNLKKDVEKGKIHKFEEKVRRIAMYRPFTKNWLYYEKSMIERPGLWSQLFPTKNHKNLILCVTGIGVNKDFSVLITDVIPDLQIQANGQCFPLYYYEENKNQAANLFDTSNEEQYIRRDAISDFILERARKQYGIIRGHAPLSKEDIFYYVYGFLHSTQYRETFASDLKKMLPRLPLVEDVRDFWAFSKAGRKLAALHLNYELQVTSYELQDGVIDYLQPEKEEFDYEYQMAAESKIKYYTQKDFDLYKVEKMRFPKKEQKDTIIYNSRITIKNIPETAYEYVVNGKSAIEWIMERYQISKHKESGIENNPNDWSVENKKPRYILDLLLNVINLSVKTVEIVKGLPEVKFEE